MDKSVGTTIEKIKLQELNNEAKLKEKRELEATVASLNRNLRETITLVEKSEQEQSELTKRIGKLRCQVELARIRRDALLTQIDAYKNELEELKNKSDEGISSVWCLRSSICHAVQNASDNYDIWALLMKPITVEPSPQINNPSSDDQHQALEFEGKLKEALQRRESALAERERLLNEPDTGEEFIRTCFRRNNLRFSSRNIEINENEPIKFSTSGAAIKKTIQPIKIVKNNNMPWYQPYCVVGSVAIFLIYFCILREENDVDNEFNKTLYERIKGLEKHQLLLSYKFNKENGKSVEDIEKRLKEIEEEESKAQL
ncbi:unnamed protein product [Parnassius mnemosyne]|uniref:Uncharacterized protein n=1 Tax=Parnassius mnemosyne TaxID=213953 RepID=A0AAV1LK14_9NEOP